MSLWVCEFLSSWVLEFLSLQVDAFRSCWFSWVYASELITLDKRRVEEFSCNSLVNSLTPTLYLLVGSLILFTCLLVYSLTCYSSTFPLVNLSTHQLIYSLTCLLLNVSINKRPNSIKPLGRYKLWITKIEVNRPSSSCSTPFHGTGHAPKQRG